MSYNHLNLPEQVSGAVSVGYVYDATGGKLRKVTPAGTVNYINGIQYKTDGTIDFIQNGEGIARNNNVGSYSFEYNLTDHLGNVRATFYQNPNPPYGIEVLQRDDYYAFGLRKMGVPNSNNNKYLCNGKELQDELGQYDYGARFYDPVIGRWNVVDPLSEKFISVSPYNYTDNNPVNNTDPDGMDIIYGANSTTYTGADAQSAFSQLKSQMSSNQGDDQDDPKKKKKEEKSTGMQLFDGLVSGLGDLMKALAPIRPLEDDEPQTIGELWNALKKAPDNISDVYSSGSLEDKTRLTTGLLGLLRGKKPSVTGVVLNGASNSSKLLYFGRIAVNKELFHRVIKKNILNNAGEYGKKVGLNPDIKVVGGNIQLTGTGPFKGKSFQTNLKATEYLK